MAALYETPEKIDLYKLHKDEYAATRKPAIVNLKPATYCADRGIDDRSTGEPQRRFPIGRAPASPSVLGLGDAPQNTILRYGRVQLCATSFVVHPADQAVPGD
ncbi:MAG: hypothetical protein FJ398_25835 [Verrucomicrobia bacterium]|nr:hypothetical protein [Verrucomicrobiota bacterium]